MAGLLDRVVPSKAYTPKGLLDRQIRLGIQPSQAGLIPGKSPWSAAWDALKQDAGTIGRGLKKFEKDLRFTLSPEFYPSVMLDPRNADPITALAGLFAGGAYTGGGLLGGGTGGIRMFAGPKAATADKTALKKAKEMWKADKTREEIWDETGWYKDVDDNWKFEISDELAKTVKTPRRSFYPRSGDLLEHPELYSAYPKPARGYGDIADEMTMVDRRIGYLQEVKNNTGKPGYETFTSEMAEDLPKLRERYRGLARKRRSFVEGLEAIPTGGGESGRRMGSYNPAIDQIYNYAGRSADPDKFKSVQLHELQHAIQHREGFAKGGSPSQVAGKYANPEHKRWHEKQDVVEKMKSIRNSKEYTDEMNAANKLFKTKYEPKIDKLENKLDELSPNDPKWSSTEEKIENLFMGYKAEEQTPLLNELSRLNRKYGVNIKEPQPYIDPEKAYKLLAGEAEARNVQTRMGFTPAERKFKPPWATLDVPEDELLIRGLLD